MSSQAASHAASVAPLAGGPSSAISPRCFAACREVLMLEIFKRMTRSIIHHAVHSFRQVLAECTARATTNAFCVAAEELHGQLKHGSCEPHPGNHLQQSFSIARAEPSYAVEVEMISIVLQRIRDVKIGWSTEADVTTALQEPKPLVVVRGFSLRSFLDEYDLLSGDHKGSLGKMDLDKRGPHLEFFVWGQKASAAVVMTGSVKCWPMDTSAKHDDESNQEAVAANSAEASSCAEASKLRGYDLFGEEVASCLVIRHGRLTGPGSGEEAAQAISALAPRQVMVELCQRRYGQVMTSLQLGLPMRPPSKLDLLGNVHGGLLQHELAPILQAARSVGAAILPIDRPQSATRSRVAHRLWHPKLLQGLLSFAGYSLRKQRDSLSPALPYDAEEIRRELERCCPVAHDVLIDERSFYLAQQVAVSSVPDTDVAVVCSAPMSTYLVSALRQVPDMQKSKDPQAGATRLLKLAKRGVPVWPLYAFAYGVVPAGLTAFAAVCFWDAFLYPALFQEMSSQPQA
ncbi:unnamed protein product [Symbiodinium necroappetens]|uniref:Uncharacterized protein n=1 Tax=Symbiodinium necroappetens TaxID=1628268 RepID=A0A813CDG8_9DINO|nr:unnamed protein product [Symbiodinium necroappetens]